MTEADNNSNQTADKVRWQSVAAAIVALVGLGDAVYLTGKHFSGSTVPCDMVSGCEKVLTSQWSEVAGIPLAAFGAAAYFFAFSLSILVAFGRSGLWKWFGAQAFVMAAFSGWLFYLQAIEIGAFCQFCLLSAASSTLLFTLFVSSLFKKLLGQLATVVAVVVALTAIGVTLLSGNSKETGTEDVPNVPVLSLATATAGALPPNMKGSPSATVVLEEFIDFQCDACAAKHPLIKEITAEYGDRISFTMRNFPIGERKRAFDAALAAEAAGLQGRFWEMHDRLFKDQADWSTSDEHRRFFEKYARELGLDVARFKTDIDSEIVNARVQADISRGQSGGVRSTPSLFVNGILIPFKDLTRDGLKAAIDGALESQSK